MGWMLRITKTKLCMGKLGHRNCVRDTNKSDEPTPSTNNSSDIKTDNKHNDKLQLKAD